MYTIIIIQPVYGSLIQKYRKLLLISSGLMHLDKGFLEGLCVEGLISDRACKWKDLYLSGPINGVAYICEGL